MDSRMSSHMSSRMSMRMNMLMHMMPWCAACGVHKNGRTYIAA